MPLNSKFLVVILFICLISLVQDGESFTRKDSTYIGSIPNVTVIAGQDATMACVMEDINAYHVIWTRFDDNNNFFAVEINNQQVITARDGVSLEYDKRHSASLLHIKNVTFEDQGSYICYLNTTPITYQRGFLHVAASSAINISTSVIRICIFVIPLIIKQWNVL